MSDQDFFFDEEETAEAGTKETAKPSAKTESKAAPAARKPAPKPAPKPAAAAPAGGSPSFFEQQVSITVASLMTVIGLLLGVIVGFLVAPDGGTVTTAAPAATTATDSGATAPQLTDEQLSSGALPEGHPDIGSATTTATTGQ